MVLSEAVWSPFLYLCFFFLVWSYKINFIFQRTKLDIIFLKYYFNCSLFVTYFIRMLFLRLASGNLCGIRVLNIQERERRQTLDIASIFEYSRLFFLFFMVLFALISNLILLIGKLNDEPCVWLTRAYF